MERRHEQSPPPNEPWPVRVIFVLGPIAAIALFLVWFVAGKQAATLDALPAHFKDTESIEDALKQLGTEQHDHGSRIENYLRQLCVSSAKTAEDRRDCLTVR